MSTATAAVLDRNDTLLGVCEALGEDFGFNPLWLRIAFALPLIWDPVAVFGAYLALGVVVLLSRLIVPSRRRAASTEAAPAVELPLAVRSDELLPELAVAA